MYKVIAPTLNRFTASSDTKTVSPAQAVTLDNVSVANWALTPCGFRMRLRPTINDERRRVNFFITWVFGNTKLLN
jgi:hypothetical protein